MKARPNILFSSTVQWNVGDEFILRGILNSLHDAGADFNAVLFNRNPALSTPWDPLFAWPPKPSVPPENSARLLSEEPVNYVIFAGTPEWCAGPRADRLHRFIRENNLRCAFLGVGLERLENLAEDPASVLRSHTDLFVARDQHAFDTAKRHLTPLRHSCPAILCCRSERLRPAPRRIGFVLQDSRTLWQSVPPKTRDYMVAQYRLLAEQFDMVCIGHYLDDLALAESAGIPCRYSFRSEDYEEFYSDCDLVVSARVHGAGIAASLGIPSILIAHDGRAETAHGFGAVVVPPGTPLLELIKNTDWASRSRHVIALKEEARKFYARWIAGLSAWS